MPNDDVKGLSELYYSINDCLVTLRQLNYGSDLKSSDTLRQVIQRLPSKMHMKWAEYSLIIRRKEEPNLEHLNEWLQARVLAMKEAYLPDSTKKSKEGKFTAATTVVEKKREKPKTSCNLCKNNHLFWKCDQYTAMKPSERFQTAKRLEKCFNCLTDGHKTKDCSSKCSCLTPGCDDKHHTSLHGYFTEGGRSPKVNNEKGDSSQSKETKKADGKKVVNGRTGLSRKNVYLMIVRIKLFCKNGTTIETYALLDDCSESTLIRSDIAKQLGHRMHAESIDLATIKGEAEESTDVHGMKLKISSIDEKFTVMIEEAYAVDRECFNMPSRPAFQRSS